MRKFLLTFSLLCSLNAGASTYNINFPAEYDESYKAFFLDAIGRAYNGLFTSQAVYDCIYAQSRLEKIDNDSVTAWFGNLFTPDGTLFQRQWYALNVYHRTSNPLPDITILWENDPNTFAYGFANYGKLGAFQGDAPGTVKWQGGFEVKINVAKLAETQDKDIWAGLIAHEMAHNMSHAHPSPSEVGLDEAYSPNYLINALQSCVAAQGVLNYNYALNYRCGGRL